MPEQWVIHSEVVQAARNQPKHILSLGKRSAVCSRQYGTAERTRQRYLCCEVPVPRKECRNEAEHSATLYVGNVRIDIYSSCGREQLKTLVEMLHIC